MKLIIGLLAAVVLGVGGYFVYQEVLSPSKEETVEAEAASKAKKVENEKPKEEAPTEEEIKETLSNNIDGIYTTLQKGRDDSGWVKSEDVDYNKLSEGFADAATQEFIDGKLKELTDAYYCECDAVMQPKLAYDVKFEFDSSPEVVSVGVIEPGNDMNNNAKLWTFEMIKDEDVFKINDWESKTPDEDLKLSSDDAKNLLTASYGDDLSYTFDSEYEENGEKAYAFNTEAGTKIGINAVTGSLLYIQQDAVQNSEQESTSESDTTEESSDEGETESATDSPSAEDADVEPFLLTEEIDASKKERNVQTGETLGDVTVFDAEFVTVNFQATKQQMIEHYGEPNSVESSGDGEVLVYSDANYTVGADGLINRVEINQGKASSLYSSFDNVVADYEGYWKEAPRFFEERTNSGGEYYLIMDDLYKFKHTYVSSNETGEPVTKIIIEEY